MPVSEKDLIPRILEDYDLTQAFIRLGMHLYGPEWNLNFRELGIRLEPPNPAEVKAKWDKLEAEKAEISNLLKAQDSIISKSTDEREIKIAQSVKTELFKRRSEIYQTENSLPTLDESLNSEWAAFQRRTKTEEILISALAKRELRWWHPSGTPEDTGPWERRPGYNYSIELSLVWWNKRIHGCRRQFVRVFKNLFDEWLKTVTPLSAIAILNLSPLEQAVHCFKNEVYENKEPRMSRDKYILDMMSRFPGLTQRAAKNQVWDRFAPDHWKRPGAKRKK